MIKILLAYSKHFFDQLLRNIYWIWLLSNMKFGKSPRLSFPIRVEGKGGAEFGDFVRIDKNTKIGLSSNSRLFISNYTNIGPATQIILGKDISLKVGSNFKLGQGSKLYAHNDWKFGDNIKIESYCSIFARENIGNGALVIGDGTHIGDYTIIDLVDDVMIGKEVAIGPNCTLYTHDHDYSNMDKAAWKGNIKKKPIHISDGAWIGANVTILPGVTIGERAVIASGAVLTKDALPNTLYGGVPAKPIKSIG